jgi:hypothetical protein
VELGVATVNSLSRVKVDDRVVKILTAINAASELTASRCAARATASPAGSRPGPVACNLCG